MPEHPRLACLSMVRNERDVIETFCGHLCAISDVAVIIDHGSTDGTFNYLSELAATRDDLVVMQYLEPSYDQALLMNELVRKLDLLDDVDWVLFLDADEFVGSDVDLGQIFLDNADEDALSFYWHNTPLANYESATIDETTEVWVGPRHGHHNTIAINLPRLRASENWVDQGNHELLTHRYGRPRPLKEAAPILHLPVRSWTQFRDKIDQGVSAYEAQGRDWNPDHGQHWSELQILSTQDGLTDGHINSIVLRYGTLEPIEVAVQDEELLAMGFRRTTLPIPLNETVQRMIDHKSDASQRPPRGLAISDNAIQRSDTELVRFTALESRATDDASKILSDDEFILARLDPASWPIRDLTPTAWGGHIPFMFTMFGMLRPQRYVELGSHFGASFFAACQASERLKTDTECVAVDTWAGDDHTGAYENHVYDSFCSIVDKRDYSKARMLRMYFDQAAELFDDASIDLLHIDGLHTYEAVRHDFETWLPKLVPGGVILFHDTNVHERDFGVWRLWNELQHEYQGFEFQHAHGLGIIIVDGGPGSDVERFVEILNKRPRLTDFVQHFFENLAPRVVAEARIRYAEHQVPDGNVGEFIRHAAQIEEERTRLALEVGALHRERDDLQHRIHELEQAHHESHRRNSPFVLVKSSVGRTAIGKRLAPLYRHLTRAR